MKKYNNRLSISICVVYLLAISIYFWSQSRYPQLDGKALSGVITSIPDLLSFDSLLTHQNGEGKIQEIYISLINWMYTNWKGMTYGLLFAVGLLTLIQFININRLTKNRFILAFIGVLNGFGLGICANCTTPISKSLLSGGVSPIIAINTIISSPSFNIIGVGILFSIFPWYVACIKLLFYIVIVFFLVPMLFHNDSLTKKVKKNKALSVCKTEETTQAELYALGKIFLKNVYYILSRTVPLMILGGLIGVTIMSLIPETLINNLEVNLISIVGVSIISFLLPVPMLFDTIFAGMAYNSSIPSIYSFILLLNLGGFSIYPLLILSQDIRRRKLFLFSIIFITLSISFSFVSYNLKTYLDGKYNASTLSLDFYKTMQRNINLKNDINDLSEEYFKNIIIGEKSVQTASNNTILDVESHLRKKKDGLFLSSFNINKKQITHQFETIYGEELGISNPGYRFSLMMNGIGISDYNNDNWMDIILPTANGLKIYQNIGGEFKLDTTIDLGKILSKNEITQANFYDLDGDGYKDLLVATRKYGIHILWNNQGTISTKDSNIYETLGNENYTSAISIGDIYNNGYVDIFIGRGGGVSRGEKLRNFVIRNQGNRQLEQVWLQDKILGATFGSFIWDLDDDGLNEVYEGNDFEAASDLIYKLDSKTNSLELYEDMVQLFPVATYGHMGFTMGDINNDLIPEYFISGSEAFNNDISDNDLLSSCIYPGGQLSSKEKYDKVLQCQVKEFILSSAIRRECHLITNKILESLCSNIVNITFPSNFNNVGEQITFCESIKDTFHFSSFYEFCLEKNTLKLTDKKQDDYIPQINNNILFQEDNNGEKQNIVNSFDGLNTGWSWGSFFGDLDNNGYQDLYVANGHIRSNRAAESNKIMMNHKGKLTRSEKQLGGENFLDTFTAAYIDYDNDGDLDIINTSIFGDVVFLKNNLNTQNSISFQITDYSSENIEGIGSKIIIGLPDGSEQIRYLYVGGHFLTLQDTQAHFGTGNFSHIEYMKIIWPNGEISIIQEKLKTNKKYIIHKNK